MAGTTKDKLDLLMATKDAIRQAIEDCGVHIRNTALFSSYPNEIKNIPKVGFNPTVVIQKFINHLQKVNWLEIYNFTVTTKTERVSV